MTTVEGVVGYCDSAMRIVHAYWTPRGNMLVIRCDRCGRESVHPANRWGVTCKHCRKNESLVNVRQRYVIDSVTSAAQGR